MRFMILRRADAETEAQVMPGEQLIADMMAYNQALADAGVLVAGEGLHPTSKGSLVVFTRGKPSVIDGPFAETKELIAGFTMIDVASHEEAIEWARRWPASDGHGEVRLEVRRVFTAEDFGEAFTPELRAKSDEIFAMTPVLGDKP